MNNYFGIYVEITDRCNLRCKHCYNDSGRNKLLSKHKILNLIDQLSGDGATQFAVSGGEPLMHPNIFEILKYACHEKKLNTTLITNGTLIDNEIAKNLSEISNLSIQLSLDGYGHTHDLIRGEGSFHKIENGMSLLCKYGLNKKISVHSVINSCNCHDLIDIVKYCADISVSSLNFVYVNQSGRANDNRDILMSYPEMLDVKNQLIRYLDENKDIYKGMEIKAPEITNGCPLLIPDGAKLNLRIDVDGKVFPCQLMSGQKYSIGNIFKSNLIDIVNGEAVNKLLLFLRMLPDYNEKCSVCLWKKRCKKGCPALRIMDGNFDNVDFNCYEIKKVYDEGLHEIENRIFNTSTDIIK